MFYTYMHRTADTGEIFYIGKGKGKRHLTACSRSDAWSKTVDMHGFVSEILATWQDEDDAYSHEVFLIDTFRKMGVNLVNKAPGGRWNGPVNDRRTNQFGDANVMRNPAIADKIRQSRLGKKRPDMTGELSHMKNPAIAKKVADALRGRKHPTIWVDKYKATMALKPLLTCKYCDFKTKNPGNIAQHIRAKHTCR